MTIEFTASYFSKEFHSQSSTVFQTELSYDSDFVKHLVDGKKVILPNLRAKLIVNDCVNDIYGKIGYEVQYGLIELPRSIYTNQNDNQFEFSQQIKKRLADDLTNLQHLNCYQDVDSDINVRYFHSLKTHYLYMSCISTPQYWTAFGQSNNWAHVELYQHHKYVDEYCLKTNDFIDMCFSKDKKTNDLYVYFLKNGEKKIQSRKEIDIESKNNQNWKNGKFKLDLKNNYYYIGFASVVCGCKNGGMTFEMKIVDQDNDQPA